jgi:nicotinamidase-related amidase
MVMNKPVDLKKTLIDVDDSLLVVIDIQDSFLHKYNNAISRDLVDKVVWLIAVAEYLGVPVVAMAEDIEFTGNLNISIQEALPEGTMVHNKDYFGLADNPEILAAAEATGRKTAVLVGTETDVCVAQSALGLMNNHYQVVVLKDAVATTAGSEDIGLTRMREAGAVISSVKALYYEWLRSVTNCEKLQAEAPELQDSKRPGCLKM